MATSQRTKRENRRALACWTEIRARAARTGHACIHESYHGLRGRSATQRVTSLLSSRDSLRLGADGPRPLRTGDGRHGRGCERCRCSDRPTARPCAAQGASRRRTNHEISAPRLLFGWGGVPGSRRQFSRRSLCEISPGTGARGNAIKSGV